MAEKKSKAEKAKSRSDQYKRRVARKEAEGLQRVGEAWVPRQAMQIAGKGLTRIGIVLAEPGANQQPVVIVRRKSGKLEVISYQQTVLSAMREAEREAKAAARAAETETHKEE